MNGLSRWDGQLNMQLIYRSLSQPMLLTLALSVVLHVLWLQPAQAPAMRLLNSAQAAASLPVSIAFSTAPRAAEAPPALLEEPPLLSKAPSLKREPVIEQPQATPETSQLRTKPTEAEQVASEKVTEQLKLVAIEQTALELVDDRYLPVITEPNFSAQPQPPVYPKLALKRRWQGQALVKALVNELGETERVELVESTGYGLLDQSALKAVNGWRFAAAEQGTRQIRAWVQVPVNFTIR